MANSVGEKLRHRRRTARPGSTRRMMYVPPIEIAPVIFHTANLGRRPHHVLGPPSMFLGTRYPWSSGEGSLINHCGSLLRYYTIGHSRLGFMFTCITSHNGKGVLRTLLHTLGL